MINPWTLLVTSFLLAAAGPATHASVPVASDSSADREISHRSADPSARAADPSPGWKAGVATRDITPVIETMILDEVIRLAPQAGVVPVRHGH